MFEGFPDGPWPDKNYEDYPPPEPPKWWEILLVVLGICGLFLLFFKLFIYGF